MKTNDHFVYVYTLYYYDPNENSLIERLRMVDPVVYSTFEQAVDLVKQKTGHGVTIINPGSRWRGGNYWIDRLPIVDSYERGLEYESVQWSPYKSTSMGRVQLKL